MKKYRLLKKTKRIGDRELSQIQALRDIVIEKNGTTVFIKEGDLGGYIESEKNLSHEGKCWVYEEAEVFGDAEVSENAQVSGKAKIYDSAVVSGDAEVIDSGRVYGRACIGGNAKIQDNPRIYGTAVVRGHAIVRGDSRVYGHAIVRDKAQVEDAIITGEAQMRGDAFAEGCTIKHDILALTGTYIKSPLYVCGSKESLYMSGPNLLTLGGLICDTRSLAEWSYHLTTILKEYYYNREEINEYVEYFKMFQKFGNEAFRKE